MPDWYLLHEEKALSAEENMARDEFLFLRAQQEKIGVLRLYQWEKPSFSFGVSQRLAKAVNLNFIREHNLAYVRRITGGKTVLHNDEITYAVVSSEDVFFQDNDLYKSYLLIARVLLQAFQKLGIPAELSNPRSNSTLARSNNPCFSFPTPNEIEVNGKKIAGSAQKRNNRALLQHGSIPYSIDYELYARGANFSADLLKTSMTAVSFECQASKQELGLSIISAFEEFLQQRFQKLDQHFFNDRIYSRLIAKYRSPAWNENAESLCLNDFSF